MIEVRGNFKFEITDDLRLHVWYAETDETTNPPFWYQNVKETSEPWQSKEEILEYLEIELAKLEQALAARQAQQTE